jgi:hypothetical protein
MSRNFDDFTDPMNPYAPPSSSIQQLPRIDSGKPEFLLFFRWEKLRLLYNAILGVESIVSLVAYPPPQPPAEVVFWLVILAGLANLCFCLGPVLDGYAHWIGLRSRVTSMVIFTVGTVFSAFVAYFVLLNFQDLTLD